LHGFGHALVIVDAQGFALIVALIELSEISVQVLLADMMERAIDAALEDREIALNRVCVPEAAANIFLDRMIDRAVTAESLACRT